MMTSSGANEKLTHSNYCGFNSILHLVSLLMLKMSSKSHQNIILFKHLKGQESVKISYQADLQILYTRLTKGNTTISSTKAVFTLYRLQLFLWNARLIYALSSGCSFTG